MSSSSVKIMYFNNRPVEMITEESMLLSRRALKGAVKLTGS